MEQMLESVGQHDTVSNGAADGALTWRVDSIAAVYHLPLTELLFRAQAVHRRHHDPKKVQLCTLLSIKTGGCPEDCAYCPQSARHNTGVAAERLMSREDVRAAAERAHAAGSTRFCMGAAWRRVRDNQDFERVLEMVQDVGALGMEVCCTLGMLTPEQAKRLADAGLTAYNHNLDTGPDYYDRIVSTRHYEDRLQTLEAVREAGISVCCGGIIGMGERLSDRLGMLEVLAGMETPPESIPINALVRVEGTPLEDAVAIDPIEMVRMVATTRIVLPASRVRLSAGRRDMHESTQALCFMAGANSIFTGERLLTTPNPAQDEDLAMLDKFGLKPEVLVA